MTDTGRIVTTATDGKPVFVDYVHTCCDHVAAERARSGAYRTLLEQIRQWDMLDGAADGPYWKREIDSVLGEDVVK